MSPSVDANAEWQPANASAADDKDLPPYSPNSSHMSTPSELHLPQARHSQLPMRVQVVVNGVVQPVTYDPEAQVYRSHTQIEQSPQLTAPTEDQSSSTPRPRMACKLLLYLSLLLLFAASIGLLLGPNVIARNTRACQYVFWRPFCVTSTSTWAVLVLAWIATYVVKAIPKACPKKRKSTRIKLICLGLWLLYAMIVFFFALNEKLMHDIRCHPV